MVDGGTFLFGHDWTDDHATFTGEVILRPAKSNAKSLFACQNLAPTFGRVSNWENFPN